MAQHKLSLMTIFVAYLGGLYGLAVYFGGGAGGSSFLYNELIRSAALFLGLAGSYMVLQLARHQKLKWDNVVITFFILILLADNRTSPLLMVGLGIVTTLVKLFFRSQKAPILNPAAIGLLIMSLLGLTTTWWGASFSPRLTQLDISIAVFLTIPVGLYLIWTMKKLPTLLSTPLFFTISHLVFLGSFPARILLEGTFAFFLLVMVTEPKTSPIKDGEEWVYGGVIGAVLPLFFVSAVPYPYLISLLFVNAMYALWKYGSLKLKLASIQEKT